MPLAENNPIEVEEHESDESDESDEESSTSQIEFDPDSEEAFNSVLKIDPELLRPFCFQPTWPDNTEGYREEVTDNMNEQSRALDCISPLPHAKMTPEQIAELTEDEPDLIRHVPGIEATRTRTIIKAALGRIWREQGKGGIESHKLGLELGLIRPNFPSEDEKEPNVINTSSTTTAKGSSKTDDTKGSEEGVSKGSNETFSQRDREHNINQVPTQNQPLRSPPMTFTPIPISHSKENDPKPSKNPTGETGAVGKMKFPKFWRSG